MADVFGDFSLFSEFEKDRKEEGTFISIDENAERSRIIFEAFESDGEEAENDDGMASDSLENEPCEPCDADENATTTTVEVEVEESTVEDNDAKPKAVNGDAPGTLKAEQTKDKVLSIEDKKAIAWLNDQLHKDAAEEAKHSHNNINYVIYEKNKYRRFSKILDSTRYIQDEDSPALQLLFSNNSFSRKYRQQIEQFIKGLLWNEYSSGAKPSDAYQEVVVRPGAPSCIEINPDLTPEQRVETMRQKHTFIGSSQFHNKFQIDFLGWPFSVGEPTRCNVNWEIPLYTQIFNEVFADPANKGKSQQKKKLKPSCWNCGEEKHSVAECRMTRNPARIATNRKEYLELQSQQPSNSNKFMNATRYHLDPEIASKYSKFSPGQISKSLTDAMGLRDDQLPQYIYTMRLYGYPPGWLEQAKQLESNVNVFDKHGRVTSITGEYLEDGELNEEGVEKDPSADFDIDKIVEYPGFTVAVPEGCIDEHEMYSMPPIQEHQLKETLMKQSNEKATAKKRKREADQEEKRKAKADAKRVRLESGEEGEIGNGQEMDSEEVKNSEEVKDSEKLKGEVDKIVATPKLTPKTSSSSSCVSLSKDYGTPVLVREKSALPDASKFGSGVEDHIPYENLPNATGTFEKMKDLIDVIRQKKKTESS